MNADDLEGALQAAKAGSGAPASQSQPQGPANQNTEQSPQAQKPQMSPQEEIGFHKGAINTLVAERNELVKMVGNVDAIMQAHAARLKELGVELK